MNIASVTVNIAEFGAKRSLVPSQIGSISGCRGLAAKTDVLVQASPVTGNVGSQSMNAPVIVVQIPIIVP